MTEKRKIALRVKTRRLELFARTGIYTQEYVAEKLGITGATYSRWESGKYSITAEDLLRLADILECQIADFLPATEPTTASAPPPDAEADRITEPPDIDIVTHNRAALTPEEKQEVLALVRAYLYERRAQRKTD